MIATTARLARQPGATAVFKGKALEGLRTGWYLVVLRGAREPGNWIASLRLEGDPAEAPAREYTMVSPLRLGRSGLKLGVFFLRDSACDPTVRLYGVRTTPPTVRLVAVPVPRILAAVGVFWQTPATFLQALRAVGGTRRERLRKAMAAAGQHGQQLPRSYANWLRLFDNWPVERSTELLDAIPARDRLPLGVLVFHAGHAPPAALDATLASVRSQVYPATVVAVSGPDAPPAAMDALAPCTHTAVLQAGDVIPPHALLVALKALQVLGRPPILFADEDRMEPDGARSAPLFKPQPNLALLCSGTLSRGLWLVQTDLLAGVPGAPWAECVRLAAWFRARSEGPALRERAEGPALRERAEGPALRERAEGPAYRERAEGPAYRERAEAPASHECAEHGPAYRLPYVLVSRRIDAEDAPAEALARVVDAGLAQAGLPATAVAPFPLRLDWRAAQPAPKISLLVPSRLRGATQLACLLDVLETTDYPDFEMLVVVTQDAPFDPVQIDAVRRLTRDPRARVELLRRPTFNYSVANNVAAAHTGGAILCLLNDDISTLEPDWLTRLVARMGDPSVGVVGAKLYYPNLTTQHGGVIMGMGGLADHASRFLPRGEPGYAWRGVLDQELSVVTGACLLVRRALYERLGGLDESYPTAFNDVDFCLRVREAGYGVLFAGSVELIHHETLSFGHHYNHDAAQETFDVRRMQARWPRACAADPFHNPNLSLAGQAEWELAYPPRIDPDCGVEIAKLRCPAPGHGADP